jgi:beta-alanine--pyruvate transaminase
MVRCFEAGVLIRVTGETIALSPPLIIEEAQIAQIVDTIRSVLGALE